MPYRSAPKGLGRSTAPLVPTRGAQVILDESSVRRARKILGRINQHAVSIKRGIVSLGGFLPGVSEQLLDELVFE
jgi:hypothetical protein